MTVREILAKGAFNTMSQVKQADDTLLVTLTRHDDNHVYRMWVTGLYTPAERVIKEEITEVR